MAQRPRPVVLCILDGWGVRAEHEANAVEQARTPVWHRLMAECPHGELDASESFVGLPDGQMGNSEVGHMNIGAGRVVVQDLNRIDAALADGSLARNPTLSRFVERLKASGGVCHLMGLLSPGGVHSHQDHIAGLARLIADHGIAVRLHAFLDGRDTPPQSAREYLAQFERDVAGDDRIAVATVTGRFFAMDRDKRWDRVGAAYAALLDAAGERAPDARTAIEQAYARGETDEFVQATVIGPYRGMTDGDGVVMANFRADRAREILSALLDPSFDGFPRGRAVTFAAALGMVEYSAALNRFMEPLFAPIALDNTLGALVAKAGLTQLRIAETEKYAHVTFFFNGGEETVFPGEERILVPSPKVKTYDLKPEMSAPELTDKLVEAIAGGRFDFIVVNYANTDMVGHTGNLAAAIKAVETVDRCLDRLVSAVKAAGGTLLITADHGNAEQMVDPQTHQPHTAHTLNVVPAVLVNGPPRIVRLAHGRLADVAPTLIELLSLTRPAEMTGHSLLVPAEHETAAGSGTKTGAGGRA
ncbi:MAG TPA: 2,3-bisphosphoglycerate-independent phosphoglycerate mutase [Candidatus Sulfotelmatobacter sp.]|nr:2,3-bisphosphoglycerate-independent phosphoglycerate mutase [Candidatus Sulfotelmatobacter sp.]